MNKILSSLQKYAYPRYAFLMFAGLLLVSQILGALNQPLDVRAHGEGKLDLHSRGYDLATVQRLFKAYGEEGRQIYVWNILVDMLYPAAVTLTTLLFVLYVIRRPLWQRIFILCPLIFLVADLIENVLFLSFIAMYPSIPGSLVNLTNLISRVKHFTLSISFYEMFGFMLLTILILVKNLLRKWKENAYVRPVS